MKFAFKILLIIISLLLLSYTVIRAVKLSFTHDESFTYLYSSHCSFMEIISNRTDFTSANNHILNTLFVKLFDNTLGSSEIALRLQSILAYLVYLIFTYLLVRNFRSKAVIICGFIILNTNPYLLEFFSLARGYALSISFMLVSMYYFTLYMQEEKNKHIVYCIVTASLAVLSNFSLLNYFAAIIIFQQTFIYFRYRDIRINFSKSRSIILIILLMLIIICYEPIRKLIKYKAFDFGGTQGIWKDTVESQIGGLIYDQPCSDTIFKLLSFFVLFSFIIYSVVLILKIFRNKMELPDKNGLFFYSVLVLTLFSSMLLHYLFGSPYLIERFAVFITPLYFLMLICFLNSMIEKSKNLKFTGIFLLLIVTGGMIYQFSRSANITHTNTWNYDADTKQMVSDLIHEKEKSGKEKVKLGITWLFEPAINFYRVTKHLDWLEKVTREGPEGIYDYYLILKEDEIKVQNRNLETIKEYPVSGSILLK